jgi:hypothetical protein
LDDWTKKGFSSTVNITDEAFVMLIVKHYVRKWDTQGTENIESGGSSAGGDEGGRSEDGKKKRGGTVKGDTNTCIKQKACYYEYCMKVQQTRNSKYNDKWDNRLKDEALRRMMEQEQKAKDQISNEIDDDRSQNQDETTQDSGSIFVHGMFDDDEIGEQDEV